MRGPYDQRAGARGRRSDGERHLVARRGAGRPRDVVHHAERVDGRQRELDARRSRAGLGCVSGGYTGERTECGEPLRTASDVRREGRSFGSKASERRETLARTVGNMYVAVQLDAATMRRQEAAREERRTAHAALPKRRLRAAQGPAAARTVCVSGPLVSDRLCQLTVDRPTKRFG